MLVFQALVSVNTARYNVVLIPPFAIGAGLAFVAFFERFRGGRARVSPEMAAEPKRRSAPPPSFPV
jgi:hypothetical protein